MPGLRKRRLHAPQDGAFNTPLEMRRMVTPPWAADHDTSFNTPLEMQVFPRLFHAPDHLLRFQYSIRDARAEAMTRVKNVKELVFQYSIRDAGRGYGRISNSILPRFQYSIRDARPSPAQAPLPLDSSTFNTPLEMRWRTWPRRRRRWL